MKDNEEKHRHLLKKSRYESQRRRREHPDWPSHFHERTNPDGTVVRSSENMPIRQLRLLGLCKHCHQEHTNWWMMDPVLYPTKDHMIVLCGECNKVMSSNYFGRKAEH